MHCKCEIQCSGSGKNDVVSKTKPSEKHDSSSQKSPSRTPKSGRKSRLHLYIVCLLFSVKVR